MTGRREIRVKLPTSVVDRSVQCHHLQLMLLMVWAASSFNGLVLLSGLFWFGVKWVEVSTNLVWFGFSSQWAGLIWIELSFSSSFVDLEGLF